MSKIYVRNLCACSTQQPGINTVGCSSDSLGRVARGVMQGITKKTSLEIAEMKEHEGLANSMNYARERMWM